jgi:hypothetical protein
MSRYANLACLECKVMVWLGKAIFADNGRINYFKIGGPEDPPNSKRTTLNRVIWKMLADHAGHPLRVVVEGDPEYPLLGEFVEIGGSETGDIDFDSYLNGWNG